MGARVIRGVEGWGQGRGHSGDKARIKGGVIQGTKCIKIISKKSAIALDMIFIHFFIIKLCGKLKNDMFNMWAECCNKRSQNMCVVARK